MLIITPRETTRKITQEYSVKETTSKLKQCTRKYLFNTKEVSNGRLRNKKDIRNIEINFEVYNAVLLSIITMLCIRSPELIHLLVTSLYPIAK